MSDSDDLPDIDYVEGDKNDEIVDNISKQKKIKKGIIADFDTETLEYAQKPIGKALLKKVNFDSISKGEKKYTDVITCAICGNTYTRSNRSNHMKTNKHKIYEKINKNVRKLILK
jgi:hypothetical protein